MGMRSLDWLVLHSFAVRLSHLPPSGWHLGGTSGFFLFAILDKLFYAALEGSDSSEGVKLKSLCGCRVGFGKFVLWFGLESYIGFGFASDADAVRNRPELRFCSVDVAEFRVCRCSDLTRFGYCCRCKMFIYIHISGTYI